MQLTNTKPEKPIGLCECGEYYFDQIPHKCPLDTITPSHHNRMKITVTHDIPNETIEFLLDSAGRGSSYWCENKLQYESEVKKLMSGTPVKVRDVETTPEKVHTLTFDMVEQALRFMAKTQPQGFGDIITNDFDNNTGDMFLQFALFGEIVYA